MTMRQQISDQQKAWATELSGKFDFDKYGYVFKLEDNLFLPLSGESEAEYRHAQGDELGSDGKRGKMKALHSSSALVVNFFLYWRENDRLNEIAKACGISDGMTKMQFEQIFPTGLEGNSPEPDILFTGAGLKPVAVESKFTEPYQKHTVRKIKDKYFESLNLWAGLPKCESLARLIKQEEQGKTSFTYLDAPQLIKHILGLTKTFGKLQFELLYLWYELSSTEAEEHKKQLTEFKEYIKGEVHFRDITYHHVFENIRKYPNVDSYYLSYLHERYFNSSGDYKKS